MNHVKELLNKICNDISCSYEIRQSVIIDRFYYIKISVNSDADDIKQKIEKSLGNIPGEVFWYKIELIEIK